MVPLAATPALTRPAGSMALHVESPGSSGGSFGPLLEEGCRKAPLIAWPAFAWPV